MNLEPLPVSLITRLYPNMNYGEDGFIITSYTELGHCLYWKKYLSVTNSFGWFFVLFSKWTGEKVGALFLHSYYFNVSINLVQLESLVILSDVGCLRNLIISPFHPLNDTRFISHFPLEKFLSCVCVLNFN